MKILGNAHFRTHQPSPSRTPRDILVRTARLRRLPWPRGGREAQDREGMAPEPRIFALWSYTSDASWPCFRENQLPALTFAQTDLDKDSGHRAQRGCRSAQTCWVAGTLRCYVHPLSCALGGGTDIWGRAFTHSWLPDHVLCFSSAAATGSDDPALEQQMEMSKAQYRALPCWDRRCKAQGRNFRTTLLCRSGSV